MCECHKVNHYSVGDFIHELLVTDTIVWEVIARTPKTITIRNTQRTGNQKNHSNGSPYPIVYCEVGSLKDNLATTHTLRLRNDGSFRVHRSSRDLLPAPTMDFGSGIPTPYDRTDYSF